MKIRVILGLLFVALVCLRLPNVVWNGRFYGEEGAFFFAYAWHMPWPNALFHPLGGYLNIVASGSALLAEILVNRNWLALENAPYLTESVGLFFQVCPALLLLTSRAKWLEPRWAQPCALAFLAISPLTEEVWLQTLHAQFHLALCAFIILATETEGPLTLAAFRLSLLLLGPLCGPGAIVALPFFVARTLLERSKARALQTAMLAVGAAIQLGLFYSASKSRSLHIEPAVLACVMFVRHVILPLLGPDIAMRNAERLYTIFHEGETPWAMVLASVAFFAGWVGLALRRWREPAAWLLLPGLALAAVSYIGALRAGPLLLSVQFSTRYTFAPQALIGLSLLAFAASGERRISRASTFVAAWIVVIGAVYYLRPLRNLSEGADWRAEVAAWRQDNNHRLATWPKGWFVDLAPTVARCSPDPEALDQPDFCDQYWERM